ncbi:mechanosensitive ion channel family protein [Pleionea sediminis]|uniref:mechanosensitive ion channel family protein n=1 Tax=Pleionea sediminis TaxID=2569479 RepID=UPI0011848E02|nr:mechanosensitive ion channel family protein [Pleionea sediminis]
MNSQDKSVYQFLKEQLYHLQGESAWITEIFLIVLATLIVNFVWRRLHAKILQRAEKSNNYWDNAFVEALDRPMTWAIWVTGITFAIDSSQSNYVSDLIRIELDGQNQAVMINEVILIGLFGWFLTRFIRKSEQHLIAHQVDKEEDERIDHTTIEAISKLLRVSVTITVVLVILQTIGVSISAVLAFGGIGGIAIGFAAKDLLANFFGGLMIYLDRPFSHGDWVRSPDRNIEGTIEHIGWRQTRIRTFDKRPLYVPNAVFNNIAVENPSRMTNRRIYETVGIRYDDIGAMKSIVDQVTDMLRSHEDIEQSKTLIVNFNAFSASSIDFFIYCFTKTKDWVEFHAVKQDVLLKIADIIDQAGAEIAFPTSTLHVNMSQPELAGIEQSKD